MPDVRIVAALPLMLVIATVPARAADMVTITLGNGDAVPVSDAVTDWSGFYAGVFGTSRASTDGAQFGGGVELGADTSVSFALVGGSVSLSGLSAGDTAAPYLDALARLGVPLSDEFAVFATAGAQANLATGDIDTLIGAGAEFRLSDQVSIDARYLHGFGPDSSDQVTFGTNFHF